MITNPINPNLTDYDINRWIKIEYPVPYDTIEFMTVDKSKFKTDPSQLLVLDLEDDLLKLD